MKQKNHDEPERRASVASGCIPADTFIRLRDWLTSEPRKLSSTAFTAGIERQLAYTIEHSGVLASLTAKDARIAELEAAIAAITKSTQAYLPPDGIPAKDCLSQILEVLDKLVEGKSDA